MAGVHVHLHNMYIVPDDIINMASYSFTIFGNSPPSKWMQMEDTGFFSNLWVSRALNMVS